MNMLLKYKRVVAILIIVFYTSCKMLAPVPRMEMKPMPESFASVHDTNNSARVKLDDFFQDKNLVALIDTALKNNFDALATLQDIAVAKNIVRLRKGKLFPSISAGAAVSTEKVGLYTSQGAGDASAEITPGELVPEHLSDYMLGLNTSWEVDVWGKLRNARKAAFLKYLSTIEGRNFVITNLVAEVGNYKENY
jgi:outer membrane protein TolC